MKNFLIYIAGTFLMTIVAYGTTVPPVSGWLVTALWMLPFVVLGIMWRRWWVSENTDPNVESGEF